MYPGEACPASRMTLELGRPHELLALPVDMIVGLLPLAMANRLGDKGGTSDGFLVALDA